VELATAAAWPKLLVVVRRCTDRKPDAFRSKGANEAGDPRPAWAAHFRNRDRISSRRPIPACACAEYRTQPDAPFYGRFE
jgi:hypothetical protein